MNTVNSTALFRTLVVYAICVPLAIAVGYSLTSVTNSYDYGSYALIGGLVALLVLPLLMRWHYWLLVFSWSSPIVLFFLPVQLEMFLFMVAVSLTISVIERILDRNKQFITPSVMAWPLLALLGVIVTTAEMTGGLGFHTLGSDVYGGKKYITMIFGVLSFFAITARTIPENRANLYIFLYFFGGFLNFISDFYAVTPQNLRFIFLPFPGMVRSTDSMGNAQMELGETRMFGISIAAGAVFFWMLARYGIREIFLSGKIWRPVVLAVSFVLIFAGGFRSYIISSAGLFVILFFLEKMHRSALMLPLILLGIMGSVALVPMSRHLPHTFQRALAFLPLDIDPMIRSDAEGSTQWRLNMWSAILPQVPKYLLLGKGFTFTARDFNNYMGPNATFNDIIDPSQDPLVLSSDFHSGPLTVLIPFGIWGAIAYLWFMAAGFWVVWRNYRYGLPSLSHVNLMFYAFYIVKLFTFFVVFGAAVNDVANFGGLVGLSVALNHGVRGPQKQPKPNPIINQNPRLGLPPQPALQR